MTSEEAPAIAVDPAFSDVAYVLGLLEDEDVDWMVTHGERRQLAAGEELVRADAPLRSVLLVLDGQLEVTYPVGDRPAEPRVRGDLIGHLTLLVAAFSPVTVVVTHPAVVLELTHARLATKLELDGGFASRFYRALAVIVGGLHARARTHEAPHGLTVNPDLAEDRMRRLLVRADGPQAGISITGSDLTVEQIARVAWQRTTVAVADAARDRLVRSRAVVDRLAAGDEPIYGVTTNVGALKDQAISADDQPSFQRHILLSHAAGVGPDHPTDVVRAIMLARLNGMARGGAGVQPAVFDALLAMLNAGVHPAVPSRGSIGMSDLVPLAHLALPLVGEGEVELDGRRLPGAEGLAAAGVAPPRLGPKDGLGLVSANSASVGHGALVVVRALDLLAIADVAAALSLEALGGHTGVLDRGIDAARRFSGQLVSSQQMRLLLAGSSLWTTAPTSGVQDPISFRSATQVHGAVIDVLDAVRATLETELNSTGDNPMVLVDRGEIVSDGNFHPAGVSIAFDTLGIALAQLTSMAANRVVRLMDPHFTHLPPYLAAEAELNVGLGVLQKTATALNAEVRLGANPASLDYVPVAGAIEDHATMAVEGVAQAARAVDAALGLFAIELLVAAQAIDLRPDITLGEGTGAAYRALRERVPVMTGDRFMAHDIALARGVLDDGSLLRAAGDAIGRPLGSGVHQAS